MLELKPRTKTIPPAQWRTCLDCGARMGPGTVYVHDPRRQYGELEREYCRACATSRGLVGG